MNAVSSPTQRKSPHNSLGNMGSICRPNFSDDFGGQLQHIAWYPSRTQKIADNH
jgi:hypothetical protein